MRRAPIILVTIVLTAAVAAPAVAQTDNVDICHVPAANDVDLGIPGFAVYFGHVISVAASAVPSHVAHGDSTDYDVATPEEYDLFRQLPLKLQLYTDCHFAVPVGP